MDLLSIDIGTKNLGYTIVRNIDQLSTLSTTNISFGIFKIGDSKTDIVKHRISRLKEFLSEFPSTFTIVVERQVPQNTIAMELMYAIVAMATIMFEDVFIFTPSFKFTFIKENYDTKNLKHKRKSIEMCKNYLKNNEELLRQFNNLAKKDDVADSLNQALVYLVSNRLVSDSMKDLRKILIQINEDE